MKTCGFYFLICLPVLRSSAQYGGNIMVTLTLNTTMTPVYVGDTVTMVCRVEGDITDSIFFFIKFVNEVNYSIEKSGDCTYTIESVSASDSGLYICRARNAGLLQPLAPSNPVTLFVQELFTMPTLTVHPSTTLWEGDNMTLMCWSACRVQGTQLRYKFYRDEESVSQGASKSELRIPSAGHETSGSYWCEVEAKGKKTKKKTSEQVQVIVRENPKATLTLTSQTEDVYFGDNVTMDCSIEGSFTGWRYQWYRGNEKNWGSQIKDVTGCTYTLQLVTQSDSGVYWCDAHRDDLPCHSQRSNAVTLSVKVSQDSSHLIVSFIIRASLFLLMLLPVLVVYQIAEGFPCFDCKKARKKQQGMYVNVPGNGTFQMEAINEEEVRTTSNDHVHYNNI
ncbi:Fc receptor-like protein 5 [Polypterus senegalus]|uniref:Fc receptor-like protein 5 n=1 Tax=Polypterus senegalus TaxID=55291 RepID=UPI0019654F91|nr:Fc receptor-like protein 5 [Polypterus senegalus]